MSSVLVHATGEAELLGLVQDIGAIDDFDSAELDVLVTLDFERLVPPEIGWATGEPVAFDEEGGLAIFRVQPSALLHLLAHESTLEVDDEGRADLARVRRLVEQHGPEAIYEVTTF